MTRSIQAKFADRLATRLIASLIWGGASKGFDPFKAYDLLKEDPLQLGVLLLNAWTITTPGYVASLKNLEITQAQ